jgi:hypothetical protein
LPIPAFEARVRAHLEPLGFSRRHGPYVLPLDDLRFGWLGLNRAATGGVLRIHPNVGVGHRAIADLVDAGRPRPPRTPRYPMPVIFAPLYTLLDDRSATWAIASEDDVVPVVRDLAEVIGSVAIPFIRRFVTLGDFIDGMRARPSSDDYHLPAALMLAGRKDDAETELRIGLDKRVGHDGEWAESFRRYANFLVPGIRATPGAPHTLPEVPFVRTTREALAADLRAYGEAVLAGAAAHLTDDQMHQIGVRAHAIAVAPDPGRTTGMLLAKALSLAAVEVVEGQPRDLHRQRRNLKGFQETGLLRDAR